MLKHFRFLAVLFILCTGSLFAYIHPCAGGWGVEAEYLYILPSVDDTYFVINSTTGAAFPNGTRENNDFGFHSGFRVGGIYAFCDCNREALVYYTRLRAQESKTVNGSFLWATRGGTSLLTPFQDYPGTASSVNDLLYQRVDGLLSQELWCCCGLDFYANAGLEWAYLRVKEDTAYNSTDIGTPTASIAEKSKAWGIGPQFGFSFDYNICEFSTCFCPGTLSFTGCTSGSILASKSYINTLMNSSSVTDNLAPKDHKTWRLIPAWHARMGINYTTCFSYFAATLEVGYEFNTYVRGQSHHEFPDITANGLTFTGYNNFDLQGLYISLAVAF